jgi:hypothetical protein
MRTLQSDEWWFVITDIAAALTDAAARSDYRKKMRRRDPDLSLDCQGGDQLTPPFHGGAGVAGVCSEALWRLAWAVAWMVCLREFWASRSLSDLAPSKRQIKYSKRCTLSKVKALLKHEPLYQHQP